MDINLVDVIKAVIVLAAPLLLAWVILDLLRRRRLFWVSWIPGIAYIASGIAVLTNAHWGDNVWIGTEYLILPLSTIFIWIGAVISIFRDKSFARDRN